MENHLSHYAISLAICLMGCVIYTVFAATRYGFQNIQEGVLVRVFGDLVGICAASKIVYLSFDEALCSTVAKIDMTFMAVGGVVILVVATKDLVSKFQ